MGNTLTQICKYCELGYEDIVEMYVSMKNGYKICKECFSDIRGKGEIPWLKKDINVTSVKGFADFLI